MLEDGVVSQTLALALDAIATLWMLLVTLHERIYMSTMNSTGEIGLEFYGKFVWWRWGGEVEGFLVRLA